MKIVRLVLLMIIAMTMALSARAETRGWGLGVGVFDGDFGVQARKDLRLGGDISHICGQASVYFQNKTTFRIDADYHFVLKSGSGRFYPLAGVELAFNSNDVKFGINGGGGLNFMLTDKLAAFAEGKYVFGDWDGWAITGGVYF
jgi:hypothetical protein